LIVAGLHPIGFFDEAKPKSTKWWTAARRQRIWFPTRLILGGSCASLARAQSTMSLGRIGWSIGYERAAACSAVKATRFAGDPNKFGSDLTGGSCRVSIPHVCAC
jgi:hypothetical protein